jgi:ribosomal protein L7/L12
MNAIIDANIFLVVVAVVAAVALGVLHATAIDDLRKRTRRLGRIEAKLDLLMINAGIEFGPYEGLPAQVVDALNRGDKLEAVKFYCLAAGVSLKEAKNFIEDIQRRSGFF